MLTDDAVTKLPRSSTIPPAELTSSSGRELLGACPLLPKYEETHRGLTTYDFSDLRFITFVSAELDRYLSATDKVLADPKKASGFVLAWFTGTYEFLGDPTHQIESRFYWPSHIYPIWSFTCQRSGGTLYNSFRATPLNRMCDVPYGPAVVPN